MECLPFAAKPSAWPMAKIIFTQSGSCADRVFKSIAGQLVQVASFQGYQIPILCRSRMFIGMRIKTCLGVQDDPHACLGIPVKLLDDKLSFLQCQRPMHPVQTNLRAGIRVPPCLRGRLHAAFKQVLIAGMAYSACRETLDRRNVRQYGKLFFSRKRHR